MSYQPPQYLPMVTPASSTCGAAATAQFHESLAPSAVDSHAGATELGLTHSVCGSCQHPGAGYDYLGQGAVDSMRESEQRAWDLHETFAEQARLLEDRADARHEAPATSPWFFVVVGVVAVAALLFWLFFVRGRPA